MKKTLFLLLLFTATTLCNLSAKEQIASEKYGTTLNLGLGLGYYGYVNQSIPVFHANLELDVAKNFTIAPFITVFSFTKNYYWGNKDKPYRYYQYKQTTIPVGIKGSYYFDQILNAGTKWDFYLAGSLGFAFRKTTWEDGYGGSLTANHTTSGLYLDVHIGTEYHFNQKVGMFLDLSTGVSTVGLSFHL